MQKMSSAEKASEVIGAGQRIFVHGAAATPLSLLSALFLQAEALSKGGKPMIALTARTHKGAPRIVSQLNLGAGVVTTRAHVHYVITEYGVVDLFGRTLKERAAALISIAHPDDRVNLEREWSVIISKAKHGELS